MAPLVHIDFRQVLVLLSVLLFLLVSVYSSGASSSESQFETKGLSSSSGSANRRRTTLMEKEEEDSSSSSSVQPMKKKSAKNQTKLIKPITANTKTTKNQTKLAIELTHTTLKKLNSTSKASKSTTTLPLASPTRIKSLDPVKATTAKNKTTKATAAKDKTEPEKKQNDKKNNTKKKQAPPSNNNNWASFEQQEMDGDDLIGLSEIKDLPVKFQQTLLPDLERISTTSRAYITRANKEITKGFKPYVGNKYAPTIAALLSCAFALIPLLLVSLLFNRIKAYFSLQKLLIFIHAYLSIYFSILCFSSVVTGLEPLRFFYATSQSTYVSLQVLQTLAYVLYLLLLLMYLALVFSTECGVGSRMLGLAQTFVGFSVGLHYYMTVFHMVVLRQAPRTNWKVHGAYAMCFFVICLVARADRRKKTYLEEGGEEGKRN